MHPAPRGDKDSGGQWTVMRRQLELLAGRQSLPERFLNKSTDKRASDYIVVL